ncbi:MAG: hypothetical protein GY786_23610 [Proteobacteria bacterium]|nr:hypothetical protein [Pseudomonadota bacterium]
MKSWLVIALFLGVLVPGVFAQETLDLPEEDLDLEQDIEMEISMDEDIEMDMSLDEDLEMDQSLDGNLDSADGMNGTKEEERVSPFVYTLGHSVSYRLGKDSNIVNNRSVVRIEYSRSIGDNLFAKLDGSGSLYWSQDHRAVSENEGYLFEGNFQDAWVQKSFSSFNFKLGLQSIVWGDVEGSQATDILNPSNNQEFLFTDFEDVRVSQLSLSFSFFGSAITWEGFYTPQPLFNENPTSGSLYAETTPLDSFQLEENKEEQPEYGIRAKFKVGVSEVAILAAYLTPNQESYKVVDLTVIEVAEPFHLLGTNFNYPSGTTLFKLDIGYKPNQGVNDQSYSLVFRDKIDIGIGIEHSVSNHQLNVSLSQSRILDWDSTLTTKENSGSYSLSWSKSYLNEDLTFNAGVLGIISRSDKITNLSADYKLDDQLTISTLVFLLSIDDEDSDFYNFRDENRVEFKGSYKF